jgi:large subunit ribosomal protein L32e
MEKKLLESRKLVKSKKPKFLRQDGHKKSRLAQNWRNPRGIDNKVRLNIRGYRRSPTVGWKSPVAVKGLHASGLEMVRVSSTDEVGRITPSTQGIIIGKTVGQKKKVEIVRLAASKNIKILNMRDPAAYLKAAEEDLAKRQKDKAETKKKEAKKAPEPKKEESTIEDKLEDTKEQEKKEKDKVLTKRK